MDMEIARLTNVSWLQVSDREVMALRAAWSVSDRSEDRPDAACDNEPLRLPMLDWPPDLFADDIFCQ